MREPGMARIVYCHPGRTRYAYHIFTDLDFWDARRILKDVVLVKRNYGQDPPGDEFPTQIVCMSVSPHVIREIEKRVKKAIVSPPRHVIVQSILEKGVYEFNPLDYFPRHWTPSRMLHFTHHRIPTAQSALNSPHKTITLSWVNGVIRIQRVRRKEKYDPVIRDKREAMRRLRVPSCF